MTSHLATGYGGFRFKMEDSSRNGVHFVYWIYTLKKRKVRLMVEHIQSRPKSRSRYEVFLRVKHGNEPGDQMR